MLTTDERKALVIYRIEKAKSVFKEAKDNAQLEHWNLAGNRLYYTVYHMAHALLLYKGFSAKTHAGTIHLIGQKFIATIIRQILWAAILTAIRIASIGRLR